MSGRVHLTGQSWARMLIKRVSCASSMCRFRSCTVMLAMSARAGPPETAAIFPQLTRDASAKSPRQATASSWTRGPDIPFP